LQVSSGASHRRAGVVVERARTHVVPAPSVVAFSNSAGMSRADDDQEIRKMIDDLWRSGQRDRAIAILLEEWGDALYRWAMRRGLIASDAEDAVWWAIAEVLRHHGRESYNDVKQVLFQAVKYFAISCIRYDRRHPNIGLDEGRLPDGSEPVDPGQSAEMVFDSREQFERVRRAVERLTEPERTIVRLRHYEDPPLQVDQIAKAVGMSKRWVEKRLAQAYRALIRMVAQDDTEG
jgi:RNA polymerase sigma factor (sigma-70 family)